MTGPHFTEAEGFIHVLNPNTGGEYTLCGDAFDMGSDEEGYAWTETTKRTVTCPRCRDIILYVRKVRVSPVDTDN